MLIATVSPLAYWSSAALAAIGCAALCTAARRHPGPWTLWVARVIGLLLLTDALTYSIGLAVAGTWSAKTDLPFALCDAAVIVAAVACWSRVPVLVELTYFWGLAGTLQAVITPDLNIGFPHLTFFEYVVGHLGIVVSALYLVVGLRIAPRRRAVPRILAITIAYTAVVGTVDGVTGANYMFLRKPPGEWTLLRLLGPWPWYTLSAAGVAVVLFTALDAPFWAGRRAARARPRNGGERPPDHPDLPSRSVAPAPPGS